MPDDLLPNETVVMKLHRHWIVVARQLIWTILLVILVAIGVALIGGRVSSDIRLIAVLVALALLGLNMVVAWVRWASANFVLTDQRVILNTGVFSRSTKIIPLDRVQDCATHQSLIGRILGYGRAEIDAAGASGAEVLEYLPAPGRFRDAVFAQSQQLRTGHATL